MRITNFQWFTHMGATIGIVIGEDEVTGKKKAYIGCGAGLDEGEDARHIAKTGAKFTRRHALELLNQLPE